MRLPISKKIGLLVALTLSLILGIFVFVLIEEFEDTLLQAQTRNLEKFNSLLIKSMTFAMNSGASDLSAYLADVEKIDQVTELRVTPAELIRPGAMKALDGLERQVYESGQTVVFEEQFAGEPSLRTISPVTAQQNCVKCHGGHVGDTMAIVSVRASFGDIVASILSNRRFALVVCLVTFVLTFVVIMLLIDRQIIRVVREIAGALKRVARGQTSEAIQCSRNDELGEAVASLNRLQESLREKTRMVREIAQGNLRFAVKMDSEEDELSQAMLTMQETMQQLLENIRETTANQRAGDVDARCSPESFDGAYADILTGINEALHVVTEPLLSASSALQEYARGELSREMPDLPGKQIVLSRAMNEIRTNLLALIHESVKLASAAEDGRLDVRGESDRFSGGYRDIIEGMNATVEKMLAPIHQTVVCLKKMAAGDLTAEVRGDYRGDHEAVQQAMNTTLRSLNEILVEVSYVVQQVASGAQQVANSSQELSDGASHQASSLEEVSASLYEISAQTQQNAENAKQADLLASSVRKSAETGNQQMQAMLKAMEEIKVSSAEISKIIKAIDEIAFQTNLLALNAAVEAARAGAHGKGFAVVAEEVRNLAQRSARAAQETTALIQNAVAKVENGTEVAATTAKSLREIVVGIAKSTDLIAEIASASDEQTLSIQQINTALSQVGQVTQANTASAEESAAAAEELSSQAEHLKQMLARFKLGDHLLSVASKKPVVEAEAVVVPDGKESAKRAAPQELKAPQSPGDFITLDDEEFGKF